MSIDPRAGQKCDRRECINIPRLISDYFAVEPKSGESGGQVSFGTSGHRGISSSGSFNESHILAITQAVVEYRQGQKIGGPLYLGMDSHALSEAAFVTALEVLSGNGVATVVQSGMTYTPTPVISHAILTYNRGRGVEDPGRADGIVITPSHNPPMYGGFKYNPPTGGPADTSTTKWIQNRANEILKDGCRAVKRAPLSSDRTGGGILHRDYVQPYVDDLKNIIDMEAIAASGIHLGVHPLGGSTLDYWDAIGRTYGLNLTNTFPYIDHTFGFMTLDHDGKIRMDCSSPYAMATLIGMKDDFDLAFGNDPDGDRHGVVTREGLMNPNHYLAVMIEYLYTTRTQWPASLKVGKTLVSSGLIDRVSGGIGRKVYEVPVGFKWFVDGLFEGFLGFGGEESAGASFLRFDGGVWSTDKDGIIPCLLGAEMMAKTGKSPSERHAEQVERYGCPSYGRIEVHADARVRKILGSLTPEQVNARELAGEPVKEVLTRAPGNQGSIGGLKVCSENGWFAVRPSGTEDIYKIYAESFKSQSHLSEIEREAMEIVSEVTR